MKRAKGRDAPFYFEAWHANNACSFIEKLPHVEGVWETADIVLHPAQVFFLVQLFGFRTHAGGRRFTSALLAVARKAGKSTLAAAIMLYCYCCEDEPGAQAISAATTGDQSRIIFHIAKRMVEKEPDLRDSFGLHAWANAISRIEIGGTFKPINAKASTQDGLNPSHTCLDEIHAHKTPDLLNVLTSAAGARANPLWLYTTTEGYENPGPWAEIRAFAFKLLDGIFKDDADHFLAIIFTVDEKNEELGITADEDFDSAAWVKANPLIDVNPHLAVAIRKEAIEAQQMPSKLAEFRIKRLNRRASTSDGWINLTKWQACNEIIPDEQLVDHPCWGGLDLASTTDLCALRLTWIIDNRLVTRGWRWAPTSAVRYRTERGTVPYAAWVAQGFIKQTEGDVTDYAVIEADILELNARFKIQNIGYDAWNAADLVNRLVQGGCKMLQFIQGPKSYHPAMQATERAYIGAKLCHGGDPVLNWCASNTVTRRDQNMNMAPDKKRSADKIDDMTALLMSVGISPAASATPEKKFQIFLVG